MHSNTFKNPFLYPIPFRVSNDFIDGFAAHKNLISRLISDLNLKDSDNIPLHHLLLGVSGIGKSTFLQQLNISVAQDAGLNQQWWPLLISEAQYNVGNLTDVWRNCLQSLADNPPKFLDRNRVEALRTKITNLSSGNSAAALDLLLSQVRGQNMRLLLMIDDIDLLLSRSEEMWAEFLIVLKNASELLVIGTGSKEIYPLYASDLALSEFFQVTGFNAIQADKLRDAMLRLGNGCHSSGAERFLDQHSDRLVMLHRLTGGNPRTMILIHNLIAVGVDGDIRYKLLSMLNAITPAYLARMNRLGVLSQKIVDRVAVEWEPMTQIQIANHLELEVEKVASELAYLEEHGFVECVNGPPVSQNPVFEMKEWLFYVWYLMYTGCPTRPGPGWLVFFLKEFFSAEELETRARIHIQMPSLDRGEIDYVLALIQVVNKKPLRNALEYSIVQALNVDDTPVEEIYRLFYREAGSHRLSVRAERLKRIKAIENRVLAALSSTAIVAQPFCEALMGSPILTEIEKAEIADELSAYPAENWAALDLFLMNEVKRWRQMLGHHTVSLYKSIASGEMSSLSDTEGAESAAEHWQDPVLAALSWAAWMDSVDRPRGEKISAIERIFRLSIEADPNIAIVWNSLGDLLQYHLLRFTEAEKAYRTAIKVDPQYATPWSQLASLLKNHLRRFDDAEIAYRKAAELDSKNATTYNNFAWFLYRQRCRIGGAISLSEPASGTVAISELTNRFRKDQAVPLLGYKKRILGLLILAIGGLIGTLIAVYLSDNHLEINVSGLLEADSWHAEAIAARIAETKMLDDSDKSPRPNGQRTESSEE